VSLVHEQVSFMRDIRKLLEFADSLQLAVTGGELQRTPEAQATLMRGGQESSMDSLHVRKCAITLGLFRVSQDRYELEQSLPALEPLGRYWEELDSRNRWGARQGGILAANRFTRDLGGWPLNGNGSTLLAPQLPKLEAEAVAQADSSRPFPIVLPGSGMGLSTPTLRRGSAERDGIARLQALLMSTGLLQGASGAFDEETERAVIKFQRAHSLVADGVVGDKTWTALSAETSGTQEALAQRFIGDDDFEVAARALNVELPALKAVYKVESNGKGFVGNLPKILFEGHVFWKRLKLRGMRPETLASGNEDILYPAWTKLFYKGGGAEHQRLRRAEGIQREAALESASWGLFQIMGYHWKSLGYDSIDAFVESMGRHERDQLDAFCRFLMTKKDTRGRTLAELLSHKDWTAFAYSYNGAGYRQNAYDDKLREQYFQFAVA
jgi:hypothetical protein